MQPMDPESGASGYTTSSHSRMDSKSSLLSPCAQTQTLSMATSEFVSFNFFYLGCKCLQQRPLHSIVIIGALVVDRETVR